MKRSIKGIISLLVCASIFLSRISIARADQLVSPRDEMTRQATSVESVHTITFITPSGVTDTSDSIVIHFSSAFDVNSLTTGSVSLFAGNPGAETPRTVSAMGGGSSNGVWGLTRSGSTLTLSAPFDPFIAGVGAGKSVKIVIGGAAGNRIYNPALPGVYQISLSGAFGDTGTIFVPVRAVDTENITATVPSSGSGATSTGGGPVSGDGGSGPAGSPPPTLDGTPPIISGVQAVRVTTSSADIIWMTDEAADSKVEYGITAAVLTSVTNGSLLTSHTLHLTGLAPGVTYVFRVTSADAVGNTRVDLTFYTFRTNDLPHNPILSGLTISSISDRSAVVSWETDVDATSELDYGVSPSLSSTRSGGAGLTRLHRLTLDGLTPATTYTVRARSVGGDGLVGTSSIESFSTLGDTTPPSNPFGFLASAGRRLVTLTWTNPIDVDFSRVTIVARTDRFPTSMTDGRSVYTGSGSSIVDSGLADATTYFYTIFAFDTSNNSSSGASTSATTLSASSAEPEPPITPPPASTTTTPTGPTSPPLSPTSPAATSTRPSGGPSPITTPTTSSSSIITPSVPASTTTPPIIDAGSATSSLPVPPMIDGSGVSSTVMNPATSSQPSVSATIESNDVSFVVYARNGLIELLPDAQGRLNAFPGQPLTLRIPLVGLSSEPQSGVLTVGSSHYLLSLNTTHTYLETTFVPGMRLDDVVLHVELELVGGHHRAAQKIVRLNRMGTVYEQTLLARNEREVEGAEMSLFHQQGGNWVLVDGSQLGLLNPSMSARDGSYGYLVPNGWYQVHVKKDGYRETVQEIAVRNNVLNARIGLKKELKSVTELINPNASVGENIKAVGEQAAVITEDVREVIQAPQVQEATQNVVAPTVVAVTAASTATAVTGFNLLNYLRFLITQPLLLIGRRKRKKWGTVYNALSKQPVELVIVRLLNAATKVVVQTRITDAQGRFSFTVPTGEYLIQTIKPGFGFPTKYLSQNTEDGDFLDLYHGESIHVKDSSSITPNIPIDPVTKEETPKQVLRKAMWRKVQKGLSVGGIVASFAALVIQPSLIMGGFIVFQVGSYFLFKRLAIPPKPKEWGIVYNTQDKKPLEKTIVRIFDKKFNKLLETQVTDKDGKYGFFAGKGLYYVTAEKSGFEKFVTSDLDFTKAQEAYIDQKLALKPLK